MDATDEQVRQRAYALWESSGKPEGSEMDFWLQAEREIGKAEGDGARSVEKTPPQ